MAQKKKKKATASRAVVVSAPRAAPAPRTAPTQIVVRAPKRKAPSRRGGSRGGGGSGGFLGLPPDAVAAAAAGAMVGLAKTSGLLEKLPRMPYLGRIGTAAVICHFLARQNGSPMLKDARNALLTIATMQLAGNSGALADRIEGEGDDYANAG
jgi:hypothetical protein